MLRHVFFKMVLNIAWSLRKVTWYVAALVLVLTLHLFFSLHHMTSSTTIKRDVPYQAKLTLLFIANGNNPPSKNKDGDGVLDDVEMYTSATRTSCKNANASLTTKSQGQAKDVLYRRSYWQLEMGQDEEDSDGANVLPPLSMLSPLERLQRLSKEILLYSAFYDDRPLVGPRPVVRVLSVISGRNDSFYCQLWYDDDVINARSDGDGIGNDRGVFIVRANVTKSGRGDMVNHVIYGQYLLTCPLPATTLTRPPAYVSIVRRPCTRSTTLLRVTVPVRDDVMQREFGVCVAISFGRLNPDELVEWFELNRMFGVAEFNIYNASLASNVNDVLSHYASVGALRVHQMPPPAANNTSFMNIKLASPASLNDCMMRNMYRYRYVLALDFDEVIVPKFHTTYSGLVRTLNKRYATPAARDNNAGEPSFYSFSFRNAFFLLDFNETQSDSPLLTVRRRQRTPPRSFLYSAKSFVDPRSCLSLFNHYCYISFHANSSIPGGSRTIDVHPAIAMLHHYRACNPIKMDCVQLLQVEQQDDTMLKFRGDLLQRVQRVQATIDRRRRQ